MSISIKEYRCKRCGGRNFHLSALYQTSKDYQVLPNGKLSKKYTVQRNMPMECDVLHCVDCGETIDYWDVDNKGNIEVDDR